MRLAGIIYGSDSGIVRRIVVADTLQELAVNAPRESSGESMATYDASTLIVDQAPDADVPNELPDLAAAQAFVDARRGVAAEVATCAVIDDATGDVVSVIQADPNLDEVNGATLYQHEGAFVGGALDVNGNFVSAAGR